MPGVDLALDLPSLSDTLTDALTKTITALDAIQDDLAGDIVPSEIDINAELSMGGNVLSDVGSAVFMTGNPSTTVGSMYYKSDGEFYLRTAAGEIRVTAVGALDVTSTGGIVGDYGSGGESASYNNAAGEFRFTEDPGVYADLVCDDVVLEGSAGSVRLGVLSGISTARQFQFKSLPASGISLLSYDASDSSVIDNNATRCTNTVKVTILDRSGAELHGDEELALDPATMHHTSGTISQGVASSVPYWRFSSATSAFFYVKIPVPVGGRLKTVQAVTDFADGTITFALNIHTEYPASVGSSMASTGPVTATSGAFKRWVLTMTPVALTTGQHIEMIIAASGGSVDLYSLRITFDKTV